MTIRSSQLLRRLIALALLVLTLAVMAFVVVAPIAVRIRTLGEQIDAERAVLGRFAAVAAERNQAAEFDRVGRAAAESSAYLKGESEAIKVAALQTLLSQLASANGVRLYSTRSLPAHEREGVRLLGVRVQFHAEIEQVRALLYGIESTRPYLFVAATQINPLGAFAPRESERNATLDVRFDIFGALPLKKE